MESNIKGLVTAGHEMASELKAECGAVDMRSVAKLISDLATQLEVQLVRANALAEDQQKAIESIKQADAAVKLAHEKFSALAAENAALKRFIKDSCYVFHGEQADISDEYSPADESPLIPDTPAIDAILEKSRAQGIQIAINELLALAPRLDKRAVDALSVAVEHLCKLIKKEAVSEQN